MAALKAPRPKRGHRSEMSCEKQPVWWKIVLAVGANPGKYIRMKLSGDACLCDGVRSGRAFYSSLLVISTQSETSLNAEDETWQTWQTWQL